MTKDLERDLGLYSVITISVGAMIGSGIFVLPGIASTIAGPAVILAYLLAGLIVLPAALSKAEMATAMPEAGGTYLFIDRAMGPLMGTIAGFGVWFSLVFKSAFALVGLGAYLLIFAPVENTKAVALGLAALLVLVNVLGVKKTGRLQALIVTVVMVVLLFFVGDGLINVEAAHYHPFFSKGFDGLLAAAGFVFVSYAGVTKIASVAEEVEDPGRTIPLGMLISIGVMMLVYTLIVFVIIGVIEPASLGKTYTPMADSAGAFLGEAGVLVVSVTAVIALTGMANAGVLSSSRYPFAMARDRLAPDALQRISVRFRTPVYSIAVTGALILLLIAFVNVTELAKLASAFQILVFILINVALIAFREGDLEWYAPQFRSPAYPWVQLFGIVGGLVLLTQMGTLPMVGAAGIIAGGVLWYRLYAGRRTEREGAAAGVVRRQTEARSLEETRSAMWQKGAYRVLIPVRPGIGVEREAALVRIAANLVRVRGGRVDVVRFEEVPEQVSLRAAAETQTPADAAFERRVAEAAAKLDAHVEPVEIVSHDNRRAIVNYAAHHGVDVVLAEVESGRRRGLLGRDAGWLMEAAPCDTVFVKNRGLQEIHEIVVVADRGPYDPLKVSMANALAFQEDAQVRFLNAVAPDASDDQLASIKAYHGELMDLCLVPAESVIVRADDRVEALLEHTREADLVVASAAGPRLFRRGVFGEFADAVSEGGKGTVVLVHPRDSPRRTVLRWLVEKLLY